jgi:hypothetical protein
VHWRNSSLSGFVYKYPRGLAKDSKAGSYYLWSSFQTFGVVPNLGYIPTAQLRERPPGCPRA